MPYVTTLSKESQKKAKDELKEKAEWRDRDIDTLRQMVLSNKGIKCNTSDDFLIRFLRARKFDYQRAYDLLVNYLTIRVQTPDVFQGFHPSTVPHALNQHLTMILPHRDSEGRRIMYSRIGKWDPEKCTIFEMMRMENFMLEKIITEEETQVNGVVFIGDFEGMGMKQAKFMDPKTAKIMTTIIQEAFPCRFKSSHIVHQPAIFETVFAIIRPLMKEKMASRLNLHGHNHTSLHKFLDPSILPKELGGTLGTADEIAQAWNMDLGKSGHIFDDLSKNSIELVSQISKGKADVQEQAVTGTFRKLNVD